VIGIKTILFIPTKIRRNVKFSGIAVHRLVVERFVGTEAVQYPAHSSDGHRHRTVNRVVLAVHAAVFHAANDTDNRTLRTHRTPPPSLRQAETYHYGTIDPR